MDKFFAFFGKIVVVLLVGGALVGAGVYVGKKYMTNPAVTPTPSSQTSQVTPISPIVDTTIPSPIQQKTVRASVSAGGMKPFSAYTLSAFVDWTTSKDENSAADTLTISKNGYKITITQGAMGGAGCTFPGDKPSEMSTPLTEPKEISLLSGTLLKRGKAQPPDANTSSYTICQQNSDGSFGTFTTFGVIYYTTPLNPDPQVLAQMDAMVGSLQKQ